MIDAEHVQELLAATKLWARDPDLEQLASMVTGAARLAQPPGTEQWTDTHWQAFHAGGLLMLAMGLASVERQ